MGTLRDTALLKEVKTRELDFFGMNKALISRISVLDDLLEAVYGARCPEPSDHECRRNLIRIFNVISKELYGNLCPVVAEFGSFVMNMFTSDSDLDLSINFNNRDVPRRERIQTLRRFSKKFRRLEGKRVVKDVQLIPTARVPVLKVTDCGTNIDCDFSVENKDGIAKSHIIFIIAAIDERFRKLSTMLKVWAKTQGINSSKDGTLNSLSLILLAAFHLQCAEPPILPPFSALLKDGYDHPTVARNVVPFVNYGQKNKQSLLQLFVTLLIRLKAVEPLWAHGLCVSVTEGSWTHKIFSKNRSMSVEDFTDRSQNVARAVQPNKAIRIYQCIDESLSQINSFVDGKIDGQMLETLLFGLCPHSLTKPIMTCDQSVPLTLTPVFHHPAPTNIMMPEAEKERTLAPSQGIMTHYQSQSAPCNPVVHSPTPKKKKRAAKKKGTPSNNGITTHHQSATVVLHDPAPAKKNSLTAEEGGTSAPSKGGITHDQSATLVFQDPALTKKKKLAVEKEGTLPPSKGVMMTHDQSVTVVLQDSVPTQRMMQLAADKEGTSAPSKGAMTRDQSATLVLHDSTPTKKQRLAVENEGIMAPSKGIMIHDQSATHILHDSIPANKKLLDAEEGTLAPSKGVMTHDQSSPLLPVLHKPSPRKKIRMAVKKECTLATPKDSRMEQPRKHVSSRTGGTSQGHTRLTQETEAFDRRGSFAAQVPSRFMHGGEGMRAHERSFPPPFAHEHSSYQSFVGFPYEPSHQSTLGFPTAIPNAPLHPPPRVVDGFPPRLHDRSLDPDIEPVLRPEPPYPGRLSQTWPDHPYELGRPHMSYESDRPHSSYELSRPHMSYEPDRRLRSYEPDSHHGSYEPERPHRSYEPERPHRSYEPDRPHRTYEPGRPHRTYEPGRPHRTYEPDRLHRSYEPDRPHRAYEPDRHHRAYEPDRHHRAYDLDRPHRAYEPDRPYEAPRLADGRPFYR